MDPLVTDVEDLHPIDHRAHRTIQHDPLRRMRDGQAFDVPVVARDREAVVADTFLVRSTAAREPRNVIGAPTDPDADATERGLN